MRWILILFLAFSSSGCYKRAMLKAQEKSRHNYAFALCMQDLYQYRINLWNISTAESRIETCERMISFEHKRAGIAINRLKSDPSDSFWIQSMMENVKEEHSWRVRLLESKKDLKEAKASGQRIEADACKDCKGQGYRLNPDPEQYPPCVTREINAQKKSK